MKTRSELLNRLHELNLEEAVLKGRIKPLQIRLKKAQADAIEVGRQLQAATEQKRN
jgi:hypothetical protein